MRNAFLACVVVFAAASIAGGAAQSPFRPYGGTCTERENTFTFVEKPVVRLVGKDRYEITFAVTANCDVAADIVDKDGKVVRHLGAAVLGVNAPAPFQKNSLKQKIYWDGKDDLEVYHKHPEKLKVRVRLGLKPVFDKRLGGASPYCQPGDVWGIAAGEDGVYVFFRGKGSFGHITCRKFDHDGNYDAAIYPPPADLPAEKLGGMGFVEYEPGKFAVQGPKLKTSIWRDSQWLPPAVEGQFGVQWCRPAVAGRRIYFPSSGFAGFKKGPSPVTLHWILSDGSTEYDGMKGKVYRRGKKRSPRLALASPADGRCLYLVGFENLQHDYSGGEALLRGRPGGDEEAVVLVGERDKPGSDNAHFQKISDVVCDATGRVYVADPRNNRIQVFSGDGKYLKTISLDQPELVQVHQKTGSIYVLHRPRVKGKSVDRLTKLVSFDNPTEEFHVDGLGPAHMTLDSWSPKPRVWLGGGLKARVRGRRIYHSVRIFEEDDKALRLLRDFDEEARKETGENGMGWWAADCGDKVVCDPVREQVYYRNGRIFDLKTGRLLGGFDLRGPRSEIAFDKKGYMHVHMAHGFKIGKQAVGRVDPGRKYVECPYDYGEMRASESGEWAGVLPLSATDHQLWSWGMGVNMRGDVAVQIYVGYAPKMEEEAFLELNKSRLERFRFMGTSTWRYGDWIKRVQEQERLGQSVFFIRRRPGIPLTGATVWTFESSGECRQKAGVVAGARSNGVQIDEGGFVYFANARFKMKGEKPFLSGKGGNFGGAPLFSGNALPFTGTYIKTKGKGAHFLVRNAPVPSDEMPKRPPDLAVPPGGSGGAYHGPGSWAWVEGAEWQYAGASPIVAEHCDCPQMRTALDWYRRSYVPETYRHSIGILDTNGNLIMHLGQYGNFDDAPGGRNGAKPGEENIRMTNVRFISATDNYLVYGDWTEKLVALRLAYHAEESAAINVK